MRNLGQLFVGLLTALASSLIVLGAASLSLLEGGINVLPSATLPPMSTLQAGETIQSTATGDIQVLSEDDTQQVSPTPCLAPSGWTPYTVLVGDTLESLAEITGISSEEIYQKNCLNSSSLVVGSVLRLPLPEPTATIPPAPTVLPSDTPALTATRTQTATPKYVPCGPPSSWISYIIKSGDTLFSISRAYGISLDELMFANCLTSSNIRAGQRIFVPNVTPRWPTSTRTPVIADTPTGTNTATIPVFDTLTVTPTSTGTVTETPTPIITDTVSTNTEP